MKALKIIGIIVGVLVAAILIIPLFSPATAEVSSEIEIALEPSLVFPAVASFQKRDVWDPWVTNDSTTVVTINSKPGYVGSTYSWDGERLGTGRMEVISVKENQYIQSNLWFGDVETPSRVEWHFAPVEGGTRATWSFSQETTYPFGRLGMIFGKVFLKRSFDLGLANLKEWLESQPAPASSLGPISIQLQQPIVALVAKGGGTVEAIGQQLGELFDLAYTELVKQELQPAGPGFVHYLDYDEVTGYTNFEAGFPVTAKGKVAGVVYPVSFPEMEVVQAVHTGAYEGFTNSYGLLEKYMEENAIEVTGEVFEFYTVNMKTEPDTARWQTRIAFPLK
jgi:effector-binding domain-containing protein